MQVKLTGVQLLEMTELMSVLTNIQLRMNRVKDTFPNYHAQLQQSYSQLLIQAKQKGMVPPWIKTSNSF